MLPILKTQTCPKLLSMLLSLFILSLFLPACGGKKDTLAIIEKRPLTIEQFKAALEKRAGRITTEKDKQLLLDELVDFEVLYAAAVKKGYDRDPQIRENLRRMIAGKLRREVLDTKIDAISVTDEEIAQYYKDHPEEFMTPEGVRAALIKVAVASKASDEKRAELHQRIQKARAEALALDSEIPTFAGVAVSYSDDQPTRYRGGNTGWLEPGKKKYRWGRKVMDAIFSLRKQGEVSQVVEAEDGFYLAKLMERRESEPQPLANVEGKIRYLLIQQKKNRAEREFYDSLKNKVSVKVYREKLASIELPKPEDQKAPEPPPLPAE